MDIHHTDEFKKILTEERNKLTAELSSIAKPDPNMKGNWIADYPQMETGETGSHSSEDTEQDEVEEYEVRLETEHSLESRLLSVIRALHRIDAGTYGMCGTCGNSIPMERLQANPAAEFDIEHQS